MTGPEVVRHLVYGHQSLLWRNRACRDCVSPPKCKRRDCPAMTSPARFTIADYVRMHDRNHEAGEAGHQHDPVRGDQ